MNIKPIYWGNYLTYLPLNAIINKKYAGVGGTTAEINSKRNSIIIMPGVRGIINKTTTESSLFQVKNLYGIYGGHNNIEDIQAYLNSKIEYKKIIMTGSLKSISILLELVKTNPSLYKFNILVDECDSIIDDGSWRTDLALCYDLIDIWKKNKGTASVMSATGTEFLVNPYVKHLQRYEVQSKDNYFKFPVKLIQAKVAGDSFIAYIRESKSETKKFIAYNSIDGHFNLIEKLNLNTDNTTILCSERSKTKAGKFFSTEKNTKEYNFLTSAYFRALDIDEEGEVIIISDSHSPQTNLTIQDIIQAAARLRTKITKLTIIMTTSTKTYTQSRTIEEMTQSLVEAAAKIVGGIEVLDSLEMPTESLTSHPLVRKNIEDKWVINWAAIEKELKYMYSDNLYQSNINKVLEILKEYGYDIELEVIEEVEQPKPLKTTWQEKVEKVLDKIMVGDHLILPQYMDEVTTLISRAINIIGVDKVRESKSKSELDSLVTISQQYRIKAEIGLALARGFKGKTYITAKEAKEKMKKMFDLLGYKQTPKASLLREFFNDVKEEVKRINGITEKVWTIGSPKYTISKN